MTRENVHALQKKVITLNEVLDAFLRKSWTPYALLFGVPVLAAVIAGPMLALLAIPAWLKPYVVAALEGASYAFGGYLTWRWTRAGLLPAILRTGLLIINGVIMLGLLTLTIVEVVGYYAHLLETPPFQHIFPGALPFGILIEYLIVKLMAKLNEIQGDLEGASTVQPSAAQTEATDDDDVFLDVEEGKEERTRGKEEVYLDLEDQ